MPPDLDWQSFLAQWSRDLLASQFAAEFSEEIRKAGWLGFPPASDDQIAAAESRLRIPLPPSYKAFLKVSNGWRRTTFAIERVCGADQIDWFEDNHPRWVEAFTEPSQFGDVEEPPDEDYFAYEWWANHFKPSHLPETLQISEVGDAAVYLLNPQVITRDGEWEAWFFANWNPGAHRYRSFGELMQAEYHSLMHDGWKQPTGIIGELPDEYVGSPLSRHRRLRQRRLPGWIGVSQLTAALDDPVLARRLFPVGDDAGPRDVPPQGAPPEMSHESRLDVRVKRRIIVELGRHRGDPRAISALMELLECQTQHRLRRAGVT